MEALLKKINKRSALLLAPLALLSLLPTQGDWRFAVSIFLGGLVGLANLKGLVWSVTALLDADGARGKIVFLSLFKLLIIFTVVLVLAVLKLVSLFGLLIGLTVVVILILKEGLAAHKNDSLNLTKD